MSATFHCISLRWLKTLFSAADICSKCWTLMTIAIRILDRALRGLLFTDTFHTFVHFYAVTIYWYLGVFDFFSFFLFFKMTLDSNTCSGFTLAEEECIAGCVMKQPESCLWLPVLQLQNTSAWWRYSNFNSVIPPPTFQIKKILNSHKIKSPINANIVVSFLLLSCREVKRRSRKLFWVIPSILLSSKS